MNIINKLLVDDDILMKNIFQELWFNCEMNIDKFMLCIHVLIMSGYQFD